MNAEYHRQWYQKNKEKRIRLNREWEQRERQKFTDYKATLYCEDCGDDRTPVLDFHHLDPSTKEVNVGHVVGRWPFERLMKEIEKCVVLCANCHRMRHYNASLAHQVEQQTCNLQATGSSPVTGS